MSQPKSLPPETPAEALARSWFGYAFFATLAALITWIGILLAPPSPFALFAQIRIGILVGFGAVLLALLALTVWLYRVDAAALLPFSQRVTRLVQRSWLAILVLATLLELNLLAFTLLANIAPTITGPAKFLLVCWSLLLATLILSANWQRVQTLFNRTRNLWASVGLAIPALALLVVLFYANQGLVRLTNLEDALRGGLDYRDLTFYDDGQPAPAPPAYWQEQAQTRVRWSPYTYWVMETFDGDYINVGEDALRETPQYATADNALEIFVFGGSTVWGEGARDAYTIPGHIGRLLNERGTPHIVQNYGQSGYISTQDMLWFQMQLLAGNVPDVAIFYQGFNDVLAAAQNGKVGVTLQETMRLNDAEAGRVLRTGQPLLRLPQRNLDEYDMSRAAVEPTTPEHITERWLNNAQMIQRLADTYGVEVLFIWQPAIIYKETLTADEQAMYQRTLDERPAVFELYADVDPLMRERIEAAELAHTLVLSDLFADVDDGLFIDLVHINENGNALVAEAIVPTLSAILTDVEND